MEPVIRQNFQRLLNHLDDVAAQNTNIPFSQTLDIRRWFNYFTLDVIGDMAFDLPLGFLGGRCDMTRVKSHGRQEYCIPSTIDTLHRGTRLSTTLAQLPSIRCVKLVKRLCNATNWLKQSTGAQGIEDLDNICIDQLSERLDNGSPNRSQQDFMSKILKDHDGKNRGVSFKRLLAESIVFMNAGSETTATALSSTLYFLLSNPKCFEKLRAEVDARLGPGHDGIISYNMYLADQEMDFVIFDRFNSNPGPLPVKVERRVFVD